MRYILCGIAILLSSGGALAQAAQQGQPAPAALLEQIKDAPVTRIGSQSVRALPPAAAGKQAKTAGSASTAAGSTLVARTSDNLVGVSHNELVIISTDLDAVAARVASLQLAGAQIHAYPKLKLLLVQTAHFEQLETVRDQVAATFPDAKFDLPVTYFPRRPR